MTSPWDELLGRRRDDDVFRLEPPFDAAPIPGTPHDSSTADMVYRRLLDALHYGRLRPGQRLSDRILADQLGVSRTPVREAFLRLQEIGVVERSAGTMPTRAAVVSQAETRQAVLVWATLFRLVIAEVLPTATAELVARLQSHADHYVEIRTAPGGLADPLGREAVAANARFYGELVAESQNAQLRRAVESVVHVVRLGGMTLDHPPPPAHVISSHRRLIDAATAHDVAFGDEVLREILGLRL